MEDYLVGIHLEVTNADHIHDYSCISTSFIQRLTQDLRRSAVYQEAMDFVVPGGSPGEPAELVVDG